MQNTDQRRTKRTHQCRFSVKRIDWAECSCGEGYALVREEA